MYETYNFIEKQDGRVEATDVWYVLYNKRGGIRVVPTAVNIARWAVKRATQKVADAIPKWSLY